MPARRRSAGLRSAVTAALLALPVVSAAVAQDTPPQVARQELMEKNGDMAGVVGDMLKGERPYDGAEATEALTVIIDDLEAFITLFPEGTETGHDTRALPVIWEDWAGFTAANDEALAAAEAARTVAADGLDALRPAFAELGGTCRSCHETYRAER
jgi:cytochrome c556